MVKKAMTIVEVIRQAEQARMEKEAHLKFLRDRASRLEGTRAEGRTEGIAEGIAVGALFEKRQMARRLLARGYDAATIADITELSENEIRGIVLKN